MEGNLHYKIDWTSLWLEGNLCAIALFLFCFTLYLKAISNHKPPGLYSDGHFNQWFFV